MLPVNTYPVYTLTIPSTGEQLKYRPYLVKEERMMRVAQQSKDVTNILNTVKNVITNCALSPINVDNLASFDIEYIFIKLRAVSVGEIVELLMKCEHCDDVEIPYNINLNDIEVQDLDKVSSTIPLFSDVGVKLKYPSFEVMQDIAAGKLKTDDAFDTIIKCIDYIYNTNEVFYAKDQSREQLEQFIEGLNGQQYNKIEAFFDNMPSVSHTISYKCPKCDREYNIKAVGLNGFF